MDFVLTYVFSVWVNRSQGILCFVFYKFISFFYGLKNGIKTGRKSRFGLFGGPWTDRNFEKGTVVFLGG